MIDQKTTAIEFAKAHIESAFSDYMVFAFSKEGGQLYEFGNVPSKAVLQKMYELFLAKTNSGEPHVNP